MRKDIFKNVYYYQGFIDREKCRIKDKTRFGSQIFVIKNSCWGNISFDYQFKFFLITHKQLHL